MNNLHTIRNIALSKISPRPDLSSHDWNQYFKMPVYRSYSGSTLMKHQVQHAQRLLKFIRGRNVVADTSEEGLGNSHVAACNAQQLDLPLMIFCPKNSINFWYNIATSYGVRVVTVTNYEMARNNEGITTTKWYDMRENLVKDASICHWITKKEKEGSLVFKWRLPYKCMIVFDEEHIGKNADTQTFSFINGAVKAARKYGHKIMLLSATPIEKRVQLKSIMYFLGMIERPSMEEVKKFAKSNGLDFDLKIMHDYLYDDNHGAISSMPDFMPGDNIRNIILPKSYHMGDIATKSIIATNENIQALRKQLSERQDDNILSEINANRRLIETYKIEPMVDLVVDALSTGRYKRACLFLNFVDSINSAIKKLKLKGYGNDDIATIYGNQSQEMVISTIDAYVKGKVKILLATISKAGKSISLHDHIRDIGPLETFVIISPPTSATDLMQALKRHFRAGIKSSVTQIIPFAEGDPIEDSNRDGLISKINDIRNFTSGKDSDFSLDSRSSIPDD
jgi:hypothetical protein